MAAVTQEELAALRKDAEASHNALSGKIDTLDGLVQSIDAGLATANQNFARMKARMGTAESTLVDANTAFNSANLQGIQLDMTKLRQTLNRTKTDLDAYKDHVTKVLSEADKKFEAHQEWSRNNVTRLQQLIGQHPAPSATGPGGPSPVRKPLDQDRALEKFAILTGSESLGKNLEWYSRFEVKLNSVCPGATDILRETLKANEPITPDDVQLMEHADIAHRLDAELYALLATLHTDKAWSFLKTVRPTQGLEAYRWVYRKVTKQTPQQLLNEHRYWISPYGPKPVSEIPSWMFFLHGRTE